MQSKLSNLTDAELDRTLRSLVTKERAITAEVVDAIAEVARRRIFLDLGFSSLFSYCTEGLGYSAASAQRRIDAARMLIELPEIKAEISDGSLNFSQISLVAQSLRQKCKLDSTIEADADGKRELLDSIKGLDARRAQEVIARKLDMPIVERDSVKAQKNESVRLETTFTKSQFEILERAREVASHATDGGWSDVFAYLAEDFLKRRDPLRKGTKSNKRKLDRSGTRHETSNGYGSDSGTDHRSNQKTGNSNSNSNAQPHSTNATQAERACGMIAMPSEKLIAPVTQPSLPIGSEIPPLARSRTIPRHVRRLVFKRDRCCKWIDPLTGRSCDSRFRLDVDHIEAWALGGTNDPWNLRLLCAAHNFRAAERRFGAARMRQYRRSDH